jgi:hypothetical protein
MRLEEFTTISDLIRMLAGLERPETVHHYSVAANVRAIRSTLRTSVLSSQANPPLPMPRLDRISSYHIPGGASTEPNEFARSQRNHAIDLPFNAATTQR